MNVRDALRPFLRPRITAGPTEDAAGPRKVETGERPDRMALAAPVMTAPLPSWWADGRTGGRLTIWRDEEATGGDPGRLPGRVELVVEPPRLGRVKVVLWHRGRDLDVQFECERADTAVQVAEGLPDLVTSLEAMFAVHDARVVDKAGEKAGNSPRGAGQGAEASLDVSV